MTPESAADAPLLQDAPISRSGALVLTAAFLLLIVAPALIQTWSWPELQAKRFRALLTERPTSASLADFERGLTLESSVVRSLRPLYQELAFRALHQGNQHVVAGREGTLFLREDVELCAARGILERSRDPNPSLAAIEDYSELLEGRGIHLVLLPVPVPPALYPEQAWAGYPEEQGAASNAGYDAWIRALKNAGVDVVDLTSIFWREKTERPAKRLFLERNTHWTPRGVGVAAREVAARTAPHLAGVPREEFVARHAIATPHSEIIPLLDLRPAMFAPMRYDMLEVTRQGVIATAGDEAPVLLIGDSLSLMYTGDDPSDGAGGGLAQRLMLALGVPVQTFAFHAIPPDEVRRRLAERSGALGGKRVLVWEFTTRYLRKEWQHVWRSVPLPPG